jgi:hypothetical protein
VGEKRKKLSNKDLMHATVSAAVFMTLAFCDAGVQRCLVPRELTHWDEFLADLPLAVEFLAGFFLMVFPSTRNGIGDDGGPFADAATKTPDTSSTNKCDSSPTAMDTTQGAPPTSN